MIPSLGVCLVGVVLLVARHDTGVARAFGAAAVVLGAALTVVLWRNQTRGRR